MSNNFWSKVLIRSQDECWPYQGARTGGRNGETYGIYSRLRSEPGKRNVYAHRLAYCLENGLDPDELPRTTVIRHRCDNPVCCNPRHLESGTQADNANDMKIRGRSRKGENATRVVLTESQVHDIRRLLASGERQESIAARYGVSRPTISLIKSGKNWGWLKTPCNDNSKASEVA